MRIIHTISGLEGGGAEMMLLKLLDKWDRPDDQIEVVSLTDKGVIGEKIESLGIPVTALGMPRGRPSISGLVRLSSRFRRSPPAIVHCWMYHGNLVGGLAARLGRQQAIIWGIRSSNPGYRRTTQWTAWAGARLSRSVPRKIVCCSEVARQNHVTMGYCPARMLVIPNGFDLVRFKPDAGAREAVRLELNIPARTLLIGLVARFDPQKDHRNFIEAARLLAAGHADVHFLLCGQQIDGANAELSGWIERAGLSDRFHLLGRRDDVPRLTAALDIATCSSSYGEAFPNILGEAMACGVPCVTTDVGDSAYVVGRTGLVVRPCAPELLAGAWSRVIAGGVSLRQEMGREARCRIEGNFELKTIVNLYQSLYREVWADLSGDRGK
jgi:glycosyltransferase involved in cell wall biosynthesis